jgi:sirohydrochlorin ferrochelatase
MTTTTPTNIPLPAGAVKADDWQNIDAQPFRIVLGAQRPINGHPAVVGTAAAQLTDGAVDDGSRVEPPTVYIQKGNSQAIDELTAAQARQLARALNSRGRRDRVVGRPRGLSLVAVGEERHARHGWVGTRPRTAVVGIGPKAQLVVEVVLPRLARLGK